MAQLILCLLAVLDFSISVVKLRGLEMKAKVRRIRRYALIVMARASAFFMVATLELLSDLLPVWISLKLIG